MNILENRNYWKFFCFPISIPYVYLIDVESDSIRIMDPRSNALNMLSKFLEPPMAEDLEKRIFAFSIKEAEKKGVPRYWENTDFMFIYRTKFLSMHFNLTDKNNPDLVAKVKSGEIKPKKLVTMTHREMFPARWIEVDNELKRREFLKDKKDEVVEGILQCGRCKSKRVRWMMQQTRSADERKYFIYFPISFWFRFIIFPILTFCVFVFQHPRYLPIVQYATSGGRCRLELFM